MRALSMASLALALTAASFLVSCSQTSNPTTEQTAKAASPAPSGPVTAKTAYTTMYQSAYKWTPDVVLLRLEPKDADGMQHNAGKSMVWEATFASASQHTYRIFTYAATAQPPDLYQGVNIGHAIPWAGATRDVMPVESSAFQLDSDTAYSTAASDAAAWLKKNPDKKLTTFQLGNGYSFSAPVWYAEWGTKKAGYVAIVNATTGKVLKK
jgi:hypothetical protein